MLSDPRARPRVTREREAHQTDGGGRGSRLLLLALAWRHRRELAPMGAGVCLLTVTAVGHLASEGLAWTPLAVGLAGAGLILLWGHRPIHRWYAAGAGAAGLWAAAAWWVGLADPVVLASLAALGASAAWVWHRHHSPRARVRVIGGSAWPWFGHRWQRWQFQREARRTIHAAMGRWLVASSWGKVPRSTIRAALADFGEDHYLITVELAPGHIGVDLDNRRAASALGAPVDAVRIRDGQRADVVLVEWFHHGLASAASEEADTEPEERPDAEDLYGLRRDRLAGVVAKLGAQVVPARELARLAQLPHDWVNRKLPELASELGLQRVKGGWQRLAVEEEERAS